MPNVKAISPKTGFIFSILCLGLLFLAFAIPVLNIELGEDEGVFAVQAVRALQGQLPNLDFPIPYMGGNVFYNAFWMKVLGQNFWALRVGLLLLFILNGLCTFYVSSRLMSQGWALLTTVTTVSLTVGFYPYLNASWNALLFSFVAFIAFIKGLENSPRSFYWFLTAGAAIALSTFMKQTVGLYTAFSLYLIQLLHLTGAGFKSPEGSTTCGQNVFQKIFVLSGSILIVAYIIFLLTPHSSFHNWLFFGFPVFCLITGIWKTISNQKHVQYMYAAKNLSFLILGIISTLLILFSPYILRQGLITYLHEGLLLRPSFYIKLFYQDYTVALKGATFLALFLFASGLFLIRKIRILGLGFTLIAILLFALFSLNSYTDLQHGVLYLFYQFPLWLIGIGLIFFLNRLKCFSQTSKNEQLALAVFIWGVFLYLNTYPVIAIPYVTCNLAPLGIFMGYIGYRFNQKQAGLYKLPVFIFFGFWIVFGTLDIYEYYGQPLQDFFNHPFAKYTAKLPAEHGGLRLRPEEWTKRESIINFINTHSQKKDDFYILADSSPEIYFLTNHLNPTRYDYYLFSLADGTEDLIKSLESRQVRYIFIETERSPVFPIQPEVLAYLEQHYKPIESLPFWQVLKRQN